MTGLIERIQFINDSLAAIREYRPGWRDRYVMNPVLTEGDLINFESRHRCRLPREYREFLRLTGNGGLGVFALGQHFPESAYADSFCEEVDLSLPFPHTSSWDQPEEDFEGGLGPQHVCGSLLIGEIGCSLWERIIITGPNAGEIWADLRADGNGLTPYQNENGTRVTLLDWFLDWFEIDAWRYASPGPARQPHRESRIKTER